MMRGPCKVINYCSWLPDEGSDPVAALLPYCNEATPVNTMCIAVDLSPGASACWRNRKGRSGESRRLPLYASHAASDPLSEKGCVCRNPWVCPALPYHG